MKRVLVVAVLVAALIPVAAAGQADAASAGMAALRDADGVELKVERRGAGARIEGMSLRLYDPEARQWSVNFSNIRTGRLSPPVTGEFRDGVGVFYGEDHLNGRTILVRFVISEITPDTARFEQAFSDDGGQSWEINWIAVDTRSRDG